jgi:amicyanin
MVGRRSPRRLRGVFGLAMALALSGSWLMWSHPARAQATTVNIMNFSFQPATVTVTVGSTVTWTNSDSVAHTSTSDSGDAVTWDSGNINPGQSFSFTFSQAGTFTYHCTIHPFMKGTIVVQQASGASPTGTTAPTAAATAAPTTAPTAATAAPTATGVPLSAYPVSSRSRPMLIMGPIHLGKQRTWKGFYDGHLNTYLNTDVSNKAQAGMMGVNYAPGLAHVPMGSTPAIYLVNGRAAAGQLAVFGSQPGEADYSPLWHEVVVAWKARSKPVLLTSDNQILALAKKGKLTTHESGTILNCPIVKVGGSG